MGSVFTCKLDPCCGDRQNCTPPRKLKPSRPQRAVLNNVQPAKPVPTPDGAVEALRKCIAAMTAARKWFHDADEAKLLDEAIAQSSAALSHPADGWLEMSSAPKDGSRILTARRFGDNLHEAAIVRWSETEDEWWDDDADQFAFPDLWIPLPAAPAAKPEGE